MTRRLAAISLSIVLAPLCSVQAVTILETNPETNVIGYFGETQTPTYGQTFTVGADNVLESFALRVYNASTSPFHFQFYVMQWSGDRTTGPILWSSDEFLTTLNGSTNVLVNPHLALVPGLQFVAFVSTIGQIGTGSTEGYATVPIGGTTYSGGGLVRNFTATTNVPDSGQTAILLGLGFIGVACCARRMKQAKA